MRIATWNVNSLTARWERVSEWLQLRDADVVLIQETKQTDAKFPFGALRDLGYESAHYGQGQWNGVAIISRVGLEDVTMGFGDEDPEARVISARCAGLRVYSCYVPNGRSLDNPHYLYKLQWLGKLRDELAKRIVEAPLVVGGDFNVALTDLDCWDPAALAGMTHVSVPEREAISSLVALGLHDLGRERSGDQPSFTWWDYRNGSFRRGWGMRIDYLFADAVTASRVSDVVVDRAARKGEKPSDHAPVVMDVEVKEFLGPR